MSKRESNTRLGLSYGRGPQRKKSVGASSKSPKNRIVEDAYKNISIFNWYAPRQMNYKSKAGK